jgi:hypothetical protein
VSPAPIKTRRVAWLAAGVLVTSMLGCGSGASGGSSALSVPSGPVAEVGAEVVTGSQLKHWMSLQSTSPVPDAPSFTTCVHEARQSGGSSRKVSLAALTAHCRAGYELLRRRTLSFLISANWLIDQAAAEGRGVSNQAVEQRFKRMLQESYPGGEAEFKQSLVESEQTVADVRFKLRVALAAGRVRDRISASEAPVTTSRIASYFVSHRRQFVAPEERKIAIVERYTKPEAIKARHEIEAGKRIDQLGPLFESWKSTAGVQRIIFQARPHTLVGPVKLPASWSVFEVVHVTPATPETLAKVTGRIRGRLLAAQRTRSLASFVDTWTATWAPKTSCKAGVVVPQCREFKGTRTSQGENPFQLVSAG